MLYIDGWGRVKKTGRGIVSECGSHSLENISFLLPCRKYIETDDQNLLTQNDILKIAFTHSSITIIPDP